MTLHAGTLAAELSPTAWLDTAFQQLAGGGLSAAAFGVAAGVVLGLNPVALPAVPAVAAVMSPRISQATSKGRAVLRSTPAVAGFVIGMDAPLAVAGYFLSWVATALARASVVLSVITAALLAVTGLWILIRRGDACARPRKIPTHPADAVAYGLVFSVTACSGCAPLLIGLGSAVALLSGPGTAAVVLVAFLAGRTAVLLAAAGLGGRLLLRPGGARLFDTLVGAALLAASGYYLWLVATGQISSVLPGEAGATLLP